MPYWMKKFYLLRAGAFRTSLFFSGLLLLGGMAVANTANTISQGDLQPYQATYSTTINGITADLNRTLTRTADHSWQLRNFATLLFIDVEERANFTIFEGTLIPDSYLYSNKLSKKRNSRLQFDPINNTVFDRQHSKQPLKLPDNSFDKLSYQSHLRLALINRGEQFESETIHLVDRTRYKTYQITVLGKELIHTPAGTFNALKLKQRRPGKDKHTLIWLAPEWDYFVLRIQRIEDGEADYQIDLKQAVINGTALRGQAQEN